MSANVVSVSRSAEHGFSKAPLDAIDLLEGLGVSGDAHCGRTVQHRSRIASDPSQPNLRQVHLIHHELIDGLVEQGFHVAPGVMGENITTRGIDLLGLPTGARLAIGADAVIEVTGLRNPCAQLDHFQKGLTAAVLARDPCGNLVRLAGVMAIVIAPGLVKPDDRIEIQVPAGPYRPLVPV